KIFDLVLRNMLHILYISAYLTKNYRHFFKERLKLGNLYHRVRKIGTWNCTHLANGEVIKKLMKINESLDIHIPIICTPEELMEV
ncbi:hypothetical protein KKG61_00550, partial [bacterium]|nr:hypothetical protein [bacterium]